MKRILIASLVIAALAAVGFWIVRSGAPDDPDAGIKSLEASTPPLLEGPGVVPLDQTSQQVFSGADGEPEVWTLRKREAARDQIAAELLPTPEPRTALPDGRTETARALDAQALEAWKVGELHNALEMFEAAVEADPDDWVPRSDYGRLLVMMTDYEKAGPHLERAAELNPDSPRVWLDLYSYYQRNMQLERGFHAYEKAKQLSGGAEIVQDDTGLWRLEHDSIYP
ncbi:MAG: tetratricopeptide (TPR) repeat protein [Myxococcota bacterium]